MDARILVMLAAAAVAAFFFVKLRILFARSGEAQPDERRRRERLFREMEDRAPS
jgi:hypothetical protein